MHFSLHLMFTLLTFAILILMTYADNSTVAVKVDCCEVVKTLYKYMSVDDKFLPCTQGDQRCVSLRLVQLFIQHTSTTLRGVPVGIQGSDLVFYMPVNADITPLLVFAFFGRSVSPADEKDLDMWLSYDTKLNKIRFEDSTCDLNRNVYTTLILASLVLLMFFIAVQVVAETDITGAVTTNPVATEHSTAAMPAKATNSMGAQIVFKHLTPPPRLRFSQL